MVEVMRTTAIAIMIIAFGMTGAAQMLSGDGAAVTVYGFEFDRHAANVEDGTRLPQAAHRDAALACGYHSLAALRP